MPIIFNFNATYKNIGNTYPCLEEAKNIGEVDLLFLGSSHSCAGFDPRLFKEEISNDLRVFNMGTAGQTPIQTKILLNRYLDKLNPKVIVYEVYPATFEDDGILSSEDINVNDKIDSYSFKMALSLNNVRTWNTLFIGAIKDIFNLNNLSIRHGKYISGGFNEHDIEYYSPQEYKEDKWHFNSKQITAFKECVSMIKDRGIKLVLVYAPITKSYYKSRTNGYVFDDMMAECAEYHNFNEIMNLKDSFHLKDKDHLNRNGVVTFDEKLIDVVFTRPDIEELLD